MTPYALQQILYWLASSLPVALFWHWTGSWSALAGRPLLRFLACGALLAAIFPLAFAMGLLFPLGVRLIARESEDLIPWAWATNGCFSVLGIFGTRITALFLGFSRALILGLLAYALVSGCVYLARRSRQ